MRCPGCIWVGWRGYLLPAARRWGGEGNITPQHHSHALVSTPPMSKWQAKKALLSETREGTGTMWTGQVREQLPGQLAGTGGGKARTSSGQQKPLTRRSCCQRGLSDCSPPSTATEFSTVPCSFASAPGEETRPFLIIKRNPLPPNRSCGA